MSGFEFATTPLTSFGAQVHADLSQPLDEAQQAALRALLYRHGALVFRGQSLSDADQVRVLSHFGNVLGEAGENREIAPDGNLGNCRLLYHSDLAFTPEPFKLLSLYGLEVDEGQTCTLFASGTKVLHALPPAMRERLSAWTATTALPLRQTERAVTYDTPAFLPRISQPAIITHPVTGEPTLFVSEMQTARINDLPPQESEAMLQELFRHLYAPSNVYQHVWHNGDLVIWDNIALQHGRADQAKTRKRRLRRIVVADKTFFQLCPQFRADDPMVIAWGAGEQLMVSADN
jgi:taurine dioxygenase